MTNENRLYVGNLAEDITATALRQRFERVGPVADVELAIDRGSGRMRGFAFVTMANVSAKHAALTEMNGVMFEDRQLRVTESGDEQREAGGRGRMKKGDAPALKARITQQFRERNNMAYELDCAGTKLSFKMYPTNDEAGKDDWRVEAFTKLTPDHIVKGTAPTRRQAFDMVEKAWGPSPLDWRAIEDALENVRAL